MVLGERKEEDGRLLVTFQCTNKETFGFFRAPSIAPIPLETLVRVWVRRIPDEIGFLTKQSACLHWEIL